MATKTKTKAKDKKKAKTTRKKGAERNVTPSLACPYVAKMVLPHTTESSGKLAANLPGFQEAHEAWKSSCRKAYAASAASAGVAVELPDFPDSKFLKLNSGQMTRKQYEALVEQFNEAETPGSVDFPPRYNPVMVDAIHATNATSLRRGSVKLHPTPPADWDAKLYGPWYHSWEDENGDIQEDASGWFFDEKMPRRCHAVTAESMIDDPDQNILTFGNLRIVCGTGTHDKAAAFMIWQTERGNYRHGDAARKRMSLAGNKDVRNVVFRIEDKPNNGGGVTVKGDWADVSEMVFMPGQVLTAGYLFDKGGNQLDAKAIRALDGDTKGLRFKVLEAPIVGKVIPWTKIWAEIKVNGKAALKAMKERGGRSVDYEAGDTETKSITNICVNGKRVDPSEATPFGLKGGQINMPAHIVADGEGKIEEGHFGMGVVIGERANADRNVGVHEARAANAPAEAPKAAKKDKPVKAAKKTSKRANRRLVDVAPPVESDTANDPDPVEAEDEVEVVGVDTEE